MGDTVVNGTVLDNPVPDNPVPDNPVLDNPGGNGTGAPVSEAAPAAPPVTELVTLLTERALALAVQAPGAPSSVRISANAVEVEICWPTGPVAPVPAAPAATAVPVAAPSPAAPADAGQPGTFPLLASMVGTFYRATEPGAAPFVSEGDQVRPGQQVGIIEAMKLMVPVEADRAGEVVEFLVTDRDPVEYGQPLLRLRGADQ